MEQQLLAPRKYLPLKKSKCETSHLTQPDIDKNFDVAVKISKFSVNMCARVSPRFINYLFVCIIGILEDPLHSEGLIPAISGILTISSGTAYISVIENAYNWSNRAEIESVALLILQSKNS